MPVDVNFSDDGQTAAMFCYGLVRGKDLIQANETIYGPEHLSILREQFVDFSDVERFEINPEETRRIAQQDLEAAQRNPHMAVAIVAPSDVAFGTSRIWETLIAESQWPTKVCRDFEEAEIWLSATASVD